MADPAVIETIVIKPDEIVTALAADERDTPSVLRVTAPFSARMRARLHVKQTGDEDDPRQLLLSPRDLLAESCPPFPRADDTEARLRERADEQYSVERHHEVHEAAVAEWRQAVPDHVVESIAIPGRDDPVSISLLGE